MHVICPNKLLKTYIIMSHVFGNGIYDGIKTIHVRYIRFIMIINIIYYVHSSSSFLLDIDLNMELFVINFYFVSVNKS